MTEQQELAKAYRPADFEGAIYDRWLAADVFAPAGEGSRADESKPPLLLIPPPPRPRPARRPVRPRQDHRRRGRDPREPWSRALPRADVAVHQHDPRGHARPAAAHRGEPRLEPAPVHDGRRPPPRG